MPENNTEKNLRCYIIRLFTDSDEVTIYSRSSTVAPVVPQIGAHIGIECDDGNYSKYIVKDVSYEFPCAGDKDNCMLIDILVEEVVL